jgi:hypothetical protein
MLKGDVGMLKLSVFDILNRNNGFYRFTGQNQITDQRTNVLQRYGLLTLPTTFVIWVHRKKWVAKTGSSCFNPLPP